MHVAVRLGLLIELPASLVDNELNLNLAELVEVSDVALGVVGDWFCCPPR